MAKRQQPRFLSTNFILPGFSIDRPESTKRKNVCLLYLEKSFFLKSEQLDKYIAGDFYLISLMSKVNLQFVLKRNSSYDAHA